MFDFEVVTKILFDANESIQKDSDGEFIVNKYRRLSFHLWRWFVPMCLAITPWVSKVSIKPIEQYVGTCIAVFTALFFSLLLTAGDKVRNEKINIDKDDKNFQKFKINMKQIVCITLHIISLGIIIFILVLFHIILGNLGCIILDKVFASLIIFLLCRFMFALVCLLQRFYYTINDEINNIL